MREKKSQSEDQGTSVHTRDYHLQVKGCLGIYDPKEHRKFLTGIGGGIRFE